MTKPSGLSPRSARTRSALLAAGLDLMVERPIDAIPIDEFVDRAGVAKGSFFNHFTDKQAFANAVATEVRLGLEAQVAAANAAIQDPVERIAGGMRVGAHFALTQPKHAAVLLRSSGSSTASTHPLNKGLVDDIDEACSLGLLRPEARETGVPYWLGLCQVLMITILESRDDKQRLDRLLSEMIVLGLTGLGVSDPEAQKLSQRA